MKLIYEVDNNCLVLLKMQGVDLTRIFEIDNTIQKLMNAIKK